MKPLKKFFVDIITNILFWHPILAFFEFFIIGLSVSELLSARFGNFLFALLMGGIYGRSIDLGRYLLNRTYYDETIQDKKRKIITWKTKLHDASVDILTTSIFWGIVMGVWLRIGVGLEWNIIGTLILTYTAIYIVASGFYGKVLNWSRKKFL